MSNLVLNQKQQEAVSHLDGPMIVLSVAGSGKTTVLTERIVSLVEHHSVNPANLLAITFAKKAANEMLARLRPRLNGQSEKLTVCTFHSLGYRILKHAGYPAIDFKVIMGSEQMKLFDQALSKVNLMDDPEVLFERVSKSKNALITPQQLAQSENEDDIALSKVYQTYELLKRQRRMVDFDDLLYLPYRLLSSDENLLRYYQERFRYVLVDEFQDSSKVMVALVELLTQTNDNCWVCGDDDQIIHEFRGAQPDVFVSFEKRFNGDLKVVSMNQNYRSSKNILKAANHLIAHNQVRVKKRMKTDNGAGEPIQVLVARDEFEEAERVAADIERLLMKKVKYNQMAILTRVYRQMPLIEAALIRHDIPYTSREGLLLNRPEVKTVISVMRYLLTGKETKGLDLNRIDMLRSDLFPGIKELRLEDAFNIGGCFLLSRTPESLIEEEQSLAQIYLDALETIISRHEDFPGLMKSVERIVSSQKKDDGVQLLTIHQAKGLGIYRRHCARCQRRHFASRPFIGNTIRHRGRAATDVCRHHSCR